MNGCLMFSWRNVYYTVNMEVFINLVKIRVLEQHWSQIRAGERFLAISMLSLFSECRQLKYKDGDNPAATCFPASLFSVLALDILPQTPRPPRAGSASTEARTNLKCSLRFGLSCVVQRLCFDQKSKSQCAEPHEGTSSCHFQHSAGATQITDYLAFSSFLF